MRQSFGARVQASLKAFWGGGDWAGSGLPGNRMEPRRSFDVVGTVVDWHSLIGEPSQNAAWYACVSWIAKNVNQAEPMVKRLFRDGSQQVLPEHPLLRLLNHPNHTMDRQGLMAGIVSSLLASGNAYLGVERDGDGVPVELCWLSHTRVTMGKEAHSREPFDFWEFRQANGVTLRVPKADIVHLKLGIDPNDPRYGLSPLVSVQRQQYVLNQGANYTANVLRNFGTAGTIITPKEANTLFDLEELTSLWKAKTQGDKAGGVLATNVPVEVHYPKATPQDLALETLLDRSEADICAALGVPAQVVGLHSGRLSKTYANLREAREVAWEETLLPLLKLIAGGLGHALLPEFAEDWEKQALYFDVSAIRPLIPDEDALHTRLREDWKAGLMDRATWKRLVGRTPLPEDEGVYFANVEKGDAHGGAKSSAL